MAFGAIALSSLLLSCYGVGIPRLLRLNRARPLTDTAYENGVVRSGNCTKQVYTYRYYIEQKTVFTAILLWCNAG